MKRCAKCGQEFPRTPDFFSLDKRNSDGLGASCRTCERERNRIYMRERRKREPDLTARYYAKNRDKERERLDRWNAANPDSVKERVKRWAQENRDKRRASELRRRAQKRQSGGDHTAADIQRQCKAQKGKCYYCGVKVGDGYHVDHVVPLSRGGSNGPENIVIACPSCNSRKHDKLPHEWPEGGRLL